MHIPSSALLFTLIPSLITAADQIPLKDRAAGWFEQAKAYIPSAVPSIPDPLDAGAAAAADAIVEKVNIRNWQRKLQPKVTGEEEWMLFLTGGNKTCFGRCGHVEGVWNESVPLLKALPKTHTLKLGYLDCEKDNPLCSAWGAFVPSIFHFIFPPKSTDPNTPTPASELRIIPLNFTTTTTSDIVAIPRAGESSYTKYERYDGILHPVDGLLVKLGLLTPLGYVIWGFGSTPSWLIMIGISFISRQFMSRRMMNSNRPDIYGSRPAPAGGQAQAAPAPAPAAARPAGAPGSGKKRK